MDDMRIRPARGHWPWGLVGMLGLVLAVEGAFSAKDPHITTTAALNWRFARDAATQVAARHDVLCLGDSTLKFGLLPRVIEAVTGRSAVNLSMCGSNLPASYFLFRRAIAAGARPRAILINGLETPVRTEELRPNLRQYAELLDLNEAADLAWNARDPDVFTILGLSRTFPSFKARFQVRAAIHSALAGRTASTAFASELVQRNWGVNKGTQVMPANPEFEATHARDTVLTPPFVPSRTGPHPPRVDLPYTRRLLLLAHAHGVRVVFLLPPLSPGVQERKNRSMVHQAELSSFLSEAQATLPEMVVLDGRDSGYGIDAFWDDVHMNARGANAFSASVAQVLAKVLKGSVSDRLWVRLPPFHDPGPPRDPRYEDLNASGLAVRNARAARR